MKKKIFLRGLLGFPLGIAIGHVFSIIGSLVYGNGAFYPCTPELISLTGNEIGAVILQSFLCGVCGTSFAASSVVWEKQNWSIAKQTGIYFLINVACMLPIAYFLNWMEHSLAGLLAYLGIFAFYFALIWAIQYFVWKQSIKRMNAKLHKITNGETEI